MVQRVIQGTVVSDKMEKTVVVAVERRKKHPLYHKVMTTTSRFKAHDEANACRLGDVVRIVESRPLSRDKRWRVIEVLARGDVAEVAPEVIGREIEESVAVVREEAEPTAEAESEVEAEEAADEDEADAEDEADDGDEDDDEDETEEAGEDEDEK